MGEESPWKLKAIARIKSTIESLQDKLRKWERKVQSWENC